MTRPMNYVDPPDVPEGMTLREYRTDAVSARRLRGVADLPEAEDVLDAAQQRVVVVRRVVHAAGLDVLRDQHRADPPAARAVVLAAGAGGVRRVLHAAGRGVVAGRLVEGHH